MKVVYLCPNGFIGGAERFVLDVVKEHANGHKVQAHLVFFNDGEGPRWAEENQISFQVLKTKFKLSSPKKLLKASRELRRILLEQHANLYHATMPYAQILGALASYNLPIRRTWYQHGPVGGSLDLLATFSKVDQIFFNSMYTLDNHYQRPSLFEPTYPPLIIPPGIQEKPTDSKIISSIRDEYLGGKEGKLLLMAGRITKGKNFELAIKSLADLERSLTKPINYRLIILGEASSKEDDQNYSKKVKALVASSLKERIVFTGFKANIHEYMKASDIFIHSANNPEAFGLVLAEAMLYGSLVIGADLGGSKDFLFHQRTGLSFDPNGRKAQETLTNLIKLALDGGRELDKVRIQGQNLIRSKYTVQKTVSKLEQAYEALL